MRVLRSAAEFRQACDDARAQVGSLGLVPTMGALHEGHLALVREAQRHAGRVAVTIFVNPTQFGPKEDFTRYPRALERDVALCGAAGAELVFAPPVEEMYPPGDATRVRVTGLTEHLCGASRPHHFEGVTTVVTKLFAVAGPCVAVFGRKDYQQWKVIERMVRDLLLPVRVVGHPIVREADGLALSSRNVYLTADERARALALPRALSRAAARFVAGERRVGELLPSVRRELEGAALTIDYARFSDVETLTPFAEDAILPERALLALAVFAGSTRLIDNLVVGEEPAPLPDEA